MDVVFDRAKDAANRRKHGISLQGAAQFDIDSALFLPNDLLPYGEVRYNAIGWIGAKLHCLTFTVRGTTPAETTCAPSVFARPLNMRKDSMPKNPKFRKPVPDADSPEWTRDMFHRAKRLHELPENVQAALKRNGRGPQKAPTKKLVSIRLSPDVLEAVRATGDGWQVRIDETLRAQFVQEHGSTSTKKTRRKVA